MSSGSSERDVAGLVRGLLAGVWFIGCMAVIIAAGRSTSWTHLGIMLLGLAGLIALLWAYNRRTG